MSLESAVSILALLVGYAAKSSSMKKFFEGLFLDPRSENYMPLNVVNFVKNWADYSKQIHGGCKVFLVDGEEIGFEEMFVLITLLNSKKENRREILEAPKKPHPMSKKDNQGVIISGAVDYFWGLLARWREVEEAVGDDSEEGVVAPEKPHLLKKENQGGLISAGVDFFWGLLARWREAEEAVGEGEDSEAVRDDSKKTS